MCSNEYLTTQIITYMGNKRKLLPHLQSVFDELKREMGKRNIIVGDGFSGSGIVSRLFKSIGVSKLYTNDIAGYANTLNMCFLSTVDTKELEKIQKYIQSANNYVESNKDYGEHYIRKYWSPKQDTHIHKDERAYFTRENGIAIDKYCYFIHHKVPKKYRCYLLAMLLVECSIKNNTSGHFAAFYKKDGVGHFGGKNENDLHRILSPIRLKMPVLCNHKCDVDVSQRDIISWLDMLQERNVKTDIMYYDPPYNKHPYNIFYFLLDIINRYDTSIQIPDTLRGQPKNWERSPFNSLVHAKKAFEEMIMKTNSTYIVVSYNNDGIIPLHTMETILKKKGSVKQIQMEHKTYNRLRGIANYKREKEHKDIKEVLFVVKCD